MRWGRGGGESDFVTGEPVLILLAGPANRQGRIAADNMLGRSETYKKTQGTAICKLFDLAVASTGLNEKRLVQLGLPFEKACGQPRRLLPRRAPDQPQAAVCAGRQDRCPGHRQGWGRQAHRRAGGGPARRPHRVRSAGSGAQPCAAVWFGQGCDQHGGLRGEQPSEGDTLLCHAAEVQARHPHQVVLDVRNTPSSTGWVASRGPAHPLDELRDRLDELPRDKELLVSCQVGLRGHVACRLLSQHGFRVKNLSGGFKTWQLACAE